jgi:uncharacterized protein (DUF952 family)
LKNVGWLRCSANQWGFPVSVLYKIMARREWEEAEKQGSFIGSAVDIRDGFIHLSAPHQTRVTAEKHFAGQVDLVLVGVNEDDLGAVLKWEKSRGGDLFPHIYGSLPLSAVVGVTTLPLVDGSHQFPQDFQK